MPKYTYKVITETGNTGSGIIEADSPDSANNKLTAMGYIPTRVREIGAGAGFDLKALQDQLSPIRTSDIILFTKQFRTMIRAGVSMLSLLSILEDQTENVKLKKV
ncbi:MAG: type II secretion system F family protein, partial [Desulfobacterales bacterium]